MNVIDKYVLTSTTDKRGVITSVSSALCKMTGYKRKELIGKKNSIFKHPHTDRKVFVDLWESISSGKRWRGEIENLRKDGSSYWLDLNITPIFDKNHAIEGYTSLSYDITDKKRIEELSITDQLTQIYNRLYLDNSFNKEVQRAQRYKSEFSIVLLDIDYFKKVNDVYGHSVGDSVLIEVSNILTKSIRSTDFLGRWGGEEFMIISTESNLQQTLTLSQKIRHAIEDHNFKEISSLTCSFGISQYRLTDKKNEAVQRADEALYKAKASGRNCVMSK